MYLLGTLTVLRELTLYTDIGRVDSKGWRGWLCTCSHTSVYWVNVNPDGELDREKRKKWRGDRWRWLHHPSLSSHLPVPPVPLQKPPLLCWWSSGWLLLGTELAALCHALFIRLRSAELSCSFSPCCFWILSHFGSLLFYICTHLRLLTCKTLSPISNVSLSCVLFICFFWRGGRVTGCLFSWCSKVFLPYFAEYLSTQGVSSSMTMS